MLHPHPASALAAFLCAGILGCGTPDDARIEAGGARDHRYELGVSAEGGRPVGRLRVSVLPRPGWHLAEEASARLILSSDERVRFDSEDLTRDDATRAGKGGLDFEIAYADAVAGELPVQAHLKFGMCRDDAEGCEIVRRDLAFRLP